MGKKTIHGGLILRATLASGSGHDLLTVNPSTGEVGKISGSPLTTTLTAGSIFLGNASNVATATAMLGDVTINSSGVTAIGTGVIVNADVNASAAIAHSKMAALTASRALVSDGSGVVSVSAVTSTELGYVSGVTSPIQTQLAGKQATITGAATTITSSDLTVNRALVSNASGKVGVSTITSTELGYLSGVSSNIQTQFSGKLSATIAGAAEGDIIYYNGTNWVNLARGSNGQALYSTATSIQWDTPTINGIPIGGTVNQVLAKQSGTDFDADWETLTVSSITDLTATAAELNVLDGITTTVTELNYVDGVTSSIQPQLDSKQSSSLAHNAIWVGNSSGVASAVSPGTNGYVLTSVSGTPTWQPVSAGTAPGSTGQIVFNNAGAFAADSGLTYDSTTDLFQVTGQSIFTSDNAANNTVTTALALTHTTSGVPATGIGTALSFVAETSNGNNETGALIEAVTTDVTAASEDFDLVFKTMAAGATASEKLRISSIGAIGIGGANYGTSGQVLTSNGSGSAVSWTSIGGVSGLTANRIPYATSATTLGDDSALTWDATNNILTVDTIRMYRLNKATNDLYIGASAGNTASTGSGANTGIGHSSMAALTTGNSNTAVGRATFTVLTSGTNNTALGDAADGVTTGSYNILIGVATGGTAITGDRNVVIGAGVNVQTESGSGQLSIQNAIFGTGNTATGTSTSTGKIGIYVASPTASLDVAASTTAKSSIRIRSGTAPTAPNAGDLWFDGTNLKFYDGTTTKTLSWV